MVVVMGGGAGVTQMEWEHTFRCKGQPVGGSSFHGQKSTKLGCIWGSALPHTLSPLLWETLGVNLRQNMSSQPHTIQNFCSKLHKRERRKYDSLDMKSVLDRKEFWKVMRLFLSGKNTVFLQICIKKFWIISDDMIKYRNQSKVFTLAKKSLEYH